MKKIVALFLLFVSFQLFAEKPRIAILDFEDNSGTLSKKLTKAQMQAERKVLSIYFRKQARNKFIILSDSEQEAIIKKMKKESTRLDRNQVYKIATGMGVSADKILYTTIVPFGRKYTVTSELIDLEREIFDDENSMVGTADFDGTQESLRVALRTIVDQLMGNEEEVIPQRPKKSDDQLACERARSLREPTGWIAYKKRYSNGICIEEADRELDKMGCELAKERNTVEDWEKYLERHPNGVCAVSMEADMAILKLKRQKKSGNGGNSVSNSGISGSNNSSIRDAKACEYAKNENSVDAWQDYLASFPSGECSFEAKGNIRKLQKEREKQEQIARYLKGRKIGNLIWSDRSSNEMSWSSAKQYCEDLTEGGYTDWRLPNIGELRTLLIADRVSNRCRVSEINNCLSLKCWSCSTCTQTGTEDPNDQYKFCSDWGTDYSDGRYSRLGDGKVWLWSSSTQSGSPNNAWLVFFDYGLVADGRKTDNRYVRCVR